MNGTILQIQRFCIHDGPGIRTTVFLKGCPLSCKWCHNPEAQSHATEISYLPQQCIGCGRCATVCPKHCHEMLNQNVHIYHRSLCMNCASCAEKCPGALEAIGKSVSAEEVMKIVCQDIPFYSTSGGGLTLSGGEPLMQKDFSVELLKAAHQEQINTCIETSGYASSDALKEVAKHCDLFLYDFKLADDYLHKEWTGVSNQIILQNLELLYQLKKSVCLRCIAIPAIQDNTHWEKISELAKSYPNIIRIDILPYHFFGIEKAERIGRKISVPFFPLPTESEIRARREWLQSKTLIPVFVV